MVEVLFAPRKFGCFRVPARISIGRMSMDVYINGASHPGGTVEGLELRTIRRFLQRPSLVMPVIFRDGMKPDSASPKRLSLFEWKSVGNQQLMGGEFDTIIEAPADNSGSSYMSISKKSAGGQVTSFVVRNTQDTPQRYHLILRGPLEVSVPLDGLLQPYEELEFNTRMDDRIVRPNYEEIQGSAASKWHYTSVAVFDGEFGLLQIDVGAILDDALAFDMNEYATPCSMLITDNPIFQIPSVAGFGKKDTRKVLIRNRSAVEVKWAIKILTFRGPVVPTGSEPDSPYTTSEKQESQIFKSPFPTGTLKPFSSSELVIEAQTTLSGEYAAKVWLEYDNFANADPQLAAMKRLSAPMILLYSCGNMDLQIPMEVLELGHVDVDEYGSKDVPLMNNATIPIRNMAVMAKRPLLFDTQFLSIPQNGGQRLGVDMDVVGWLRKAVTLDFAHEAFQKSIPVAASAGMFSVRTNLLTSPLSSLDSRTEFREVFDFGLIHRTHPKYKPFTIINDGDLPFVLKSIKPSDSHLSCKSPPVRLTDSMDRSVLLSESEIYHASRDPTCPEIDWDELEDNRRIWKKAFADTSSKPVVVASRLESVEKMLPVALYPKQSISFWLFYGGFEVFF